MYYDSDIRRIFFSEIQIKEGMFHVQVDTVKPLKNAILRFTESSGKLWKLIPEEREFRNGVNNISFNVYLSQQSFQHCSLDLEHERGLMRIDIDLSSQDQFVEEKLQSQDTAS